MPLTTGDLGGCGCPPVGCTVTFFVRGCGGLGVDAATVSVYDHSGGTLLDSGNTDSTGHVTLSWTGATGTYYVVVTGIPANFVGYAATLTLTCGSPTTLSLAVATGYHCYDCCPIPQPDTLHGSFSTPAFPGPTTVTMSWSSGGWVGTYTPGPGFVYAMILHDFCEIEFKSSGSSCGSVLPDPSSTCDPFNIVASWSAPGIGTPCDIYWNTGPTTLTVTL